MELGHILWPSDPVTQEFSDPETQLTRWPCSTMNSKCRLRLCVKKYSQAKEFLIGLIIGKSKSSLHGLTASDFSPTTDTWRWLLSFQHFKCTFCILGIFFENRKNLGLTPGQNDDPVTRTWKTTQMTHWLTRWPNDPVPCLAHTRLPSVGFRSWSQFLAVSLQVTWVINPAVGCHYFPAGPQLPSQPLRGLLQKNVHCYKLDFLSSLPVLTTFMLHANVPLTETTIPMTSTSFWLCVTFEKKVDWSLMSIFYGVGLRFEKKNDSRRGYTYVIEICIR